MLTAQEIRFIKSLHRKSVRDSESLFIVEGDKVIEEAIKHECQVLKLLVTERSSCTTHPLIKVISENEMERVTAFASPSASLAVIAMPANSGDLFQKPIEEPAIYLDQISDPGNLGTMLRTADWFGISTVVASPGTVDVFNPKTIRASMGSVFRIRLAEEAFSGFAARNSHAPVWALDMAGEDIRGLEPGGPYILAVGSEAHGLRAEVRKRARLITIPGWGEAESLNAAIALGIALYQFSKS